MSFFIKSEMVSQTHLNDSITIYEVASFYFYLDKNKLIPHENTILLGVTSALKSLPKPKKGG